MQYIVLDMEWNQPWPGSYAAQKVLPVQIHGEIIQIGAVRLLETGKIADEFQVLVRPKYYKKLNSRVSKLTGLRDARLREEGLSFPEALERFRDWIGGPCIFLTWGFDDITVLEDNILLHDGEPDWITQWYNAQMIFNAQTGCGNTQKALSTAMELLGIEPSRPVMPTTRPSSAAVWTCRAALQNISRPCRAMRTASTAIRPQAASAVLSSMATRPVRPP